MEVAVAMCGHERNEKTRIAQSVLLSSHTHVGIDRNGSTNTRFINDIKNFITLIEVPDLLFEVFFFFFCNKSIFPLFVDCQKKENVILSTVCSVQIVQITSSVPFLLYCPTQTSTAIV